MNLQHIRYALEIARTGSISKAAENLSVAQPNLSRAVKELESSLGFPLFDRTRTGMTVTPEGERLLSAGERILREVAELETMFDGDATPHEAVTLVAPHAAYLSHAFAQFCRDLPAGAQYDLTYREVGAQDAIGVVTRGESRLGVVRYPVHFEAYYRDLLAERELSCEVIAEFRPVVLCGSGSPLVTREAVTSAELATLHALEHPDVPAVEGLRAESTGDRRLTVPERAARLDLLLADPMAYALSVPLPAPQAARLGVLQRPVAGEGTVYRDVMVFPRYYKLSALDRRLLEALREAGRMFP